MQKVIILDGGFYGHKAIFAFVSAMKREIENRCKKFKPDYNPKEDFSLFARFKGEVEYDVKSQKLWISPSHYTYFQMIISDLKKIGINKEDIIIVANDGRNSWRRAFYPLYKQNRAKLRSSQDHVIDWSAEYEKIENINHQLNESTNWHFIKFNYIFDFIELGMSEEGQRFDIVQHQDDYINQRFSIEADDIQAYAVRYFKDKEVILITIDEDLDQLYHFSNCKIFNPNTKSVTNKSKRGYYNVVDSPLDIINKKVRNGDVSDNIIVDKNKDTSYEFELRRFIIYLLSLPDFITEPIKKVFDNLDYNRKVDYSNLPFPNSIGKRFDKIYSIEHVVTFEESEKRHMLKKEKDLEKSRLNSRKRKEKKLAEKEKQFR